MIIEFFAAYTQGSLQMYLFICHLYQIEALELQHSSPADHIIAGTEKKSLLHYRHQKKLHLVCLQNLAYIPPNFFFFFKMMSFRSLINSIYNGFYLRSY